jgi:hypothetical protein
LGIAIRYWKDMEEVARCLIGGTEESRKGILPVSWIGLEPDTLRMLFCSFILSRDMCVHRLLAVHNQNNQNKLNYSTSKSNLVQNVTMIRRKNEVV